MIFERAGFIVAAAVNAISAASGAIQVVVLELSFDMKRSRITNGLPLRPHFFRHRDLNNMRRAIRNSLPKMEHQMEQVFHVEQPGGSVYFPLVSFHRNDNSSAVSFTSCVIETPALWPAFSS